MAHGIASSLDGKRVVIGSEHFVVEDEHVQIPEQDAKKLLFKRPKTGSLEIHKPGSGCNTAHQVKIFSQHFDVEPEVVHPTSH